MNYIYSLAFHYYNSHNNSVHSNNSSYNSIYSHGHSYIYRYRHSYNKNHNHISNSNNSMNNRKSPSSLPVLTQSLIINSIKCGNIKILKESFKSDFCKAINHMVSDGDKVCGKLGNTGINIGSGSNKNNSVGIQDEINKVIGSICDSDIDKEALVISLIYLDRAIKSGKIINSSNAMEILASCICVAHKYHQDICYKNEAFCSFFKIGSIGLFNKLERELLQRLNYNCTVSIEEFEQYWKYFGPQKQHRASILQQLHHIKKQHQKLVHTQESQPTTEVKKTNGKRKRSCDEYDGIEDSTSRGDFKKRFGTNQSSINPSSNTIISNSNHNTNNRTNNNNNSNSNNSNSNSNNIIKSKSTSAPTSIPPDSIIQTAGFPTDQVVKPIDYGDLDFIGFISFTSYKH